MCGIVGYIGNGEAVKPVLDGLTALEYRGYDSSGIIALEVDKPAVLIKQVGRVEYLKKLVEENGKLDKTHLAIGHTRWATHGAPTLDNAHPHTNKAKTIFVVHNGIIENYQALRTSLKESGYVFYSDTDTEVIPKLLDYNLKKSKDFKEAFKETLSQLEGAYAIAAIYTGEPDNLYVARLSSPLIIGIGKDCHYIASDPTAVLEETNKVVYLDDYDVAVVSAKNIKVENTKEAAVVHRIPQELDFKTASALLGDYPDFMLKEIFEAPVTVQSASRGRVKPESNTVKLGGLETVEQQLQYIDRIVIVACGTSYYAGLLGEYLIEEIAGIPVEVQLASEFKYRHEPFSRGTALIAVSQSGETADTIAAIKKVEEFGVLKIGVVNSVGSTIARITDAGVYCHAGPEQSVASTKAFIAQVTVLTEIALFLSRKRSPLFMPILKEIAVLPEKMKQVLDQAPHIEKLAKKYAHHRDFLYIGRGYAFPCALEGALKLKEVSYIHAEGYAAGEMKHGPLAMIDSSFPTFAIATNKKLHEKTLSNIEEIRARKGPVLAITTKGEKAIYRLTEDVIEIPDTLEQTQPLLIAIVLQLFAYYVAVEKELNVDRPRNLAKSVTVE
ncbi:MAG: glutamine--fructose-6-phosphate transaminase (isomerizing) [Candidatus Saccharimonadales bacterium]